jgi:hypothetical protein
MTRRAFLKGSVWTNEPASERRTATGPPLAKPMANGSGAHVVLRLPFLEGARRRLTRSSERSNNRPSRQRDEGRVKTRKQSDGSGFYASSQVTVVQ